MPTWKRKSKNSTAYRRAEAAAVEEMRRMWNEPQPVPHVEPRWGQSTLNPEPYGDCGHRVGENGGLREW